ncbi:hypothetical protein QWZ16_17460 [Vibrio ostreicida]|uniref:Uncharacterized protein n=1 Tax=Vibrio ostreicida TaxID=526588 RepID=A0ABT8BZ65_9VIBR|nr:hypothetical protein [Vibrio ostreicida]MDN3611392.1 hypothetical protein [Vibrio ostreicida]
MFILAKLPNRVSREEGLRYHRLLAFSSSPLVPHSITRTTLADHLARALSRI